MDLMHNLAIRITGGDLEGIYRIILDEPRIGKTALVRLDPPDNNDDKSRGGRKPLNNPKHQRKKKRPPNIGTLIWLDRLMLEELDNQCQLHIVEIECRNISLDHTSKKKTRKKRLYKRRKQAMSPFLSIDMLRQHVDINRGIGTLVQQVIDDSGMSKSTIYKLFSTLCRFGFSERSLQLDYDNCGAPGVPRPCDLGGRKKAGSKTTKQKLSKLPGFTPEPDQPGMSSEWTALILAADSRIKKPKPLMPDRITQIINNAFITKYHPNTNGALVPVEPEQGSYPNRRQIQHVLERNIPRLQRLLDSTTLGHFNRSHRGMTDRNWKGVSGPGHTWEIDSTIGDIYLRSSVNRSWIIGRPIVYVIVDVWSTAIVGFYVCLMGPSWNMAKLSLFSSAADQALIGSLWGYEPVLSLNPAPTLCATLLCDRGEYLSQGASQTGFKLLPSLSYAPPYRPDLKGLVEVLHRIEKDKLYPFVPGAIDARRKEYDLRRFNPNKAVFTVREFAHYLHVIFTEYNLTANREHRLDSHMKAADVISTPAGLWNWGHQMGIATRRAVSFSDLITTLLPNADATVARNGIMLGRRRYTSNAVDEQQWAAHARNFGSWKIPTNYFPGSVSTIWTPKIESSGLIQLNISDQSTASSELTWDEVLDADAYHSIGNAEREHLRTMSKVKAQCKVNNLVKTAKRLTQEAIERDAGSKPTLTEAREIERSLDVPNSISTTQNHSDIEAASSDEAGETYLETMRALLESSGNQVSHD